MAVDVAFDVIEQILVRLDVKDLIRFKSVCKLWQSLISSHRFVKSHLNHTYNNDRNKHKLGHRRISSYVITHEDSWFFRNFYYIVGSCNGLVCISLKDAEFVVTNPSIREVKKVQSPPFRPDMREIVLVRQTVCWGFGYDSCADDYKVIVGFRKHLDINRTLFYVLTLKSNVWKVIGEVNYTSIEGKSGILCRGTLHWMMIDENRNKVIISLDLSTEEFKEIPLPDADRLKFISYYCHRLGVLEDSLCIYYSASPLHTRKWVMKNDEWELYNYHSERKHDVAHFLTLHTSSSGKRLMWGHDGGKRVPSTGYYIRSSMFVKSLVSPHPYINDKNNYYGNRRRNAKILATQQMLEDFESITSASNRNISKRKRKRKSKSKSKSKSIGN